QRLTRRQRLLRRSAMHVAKLYLAFSPPFVSARRQFAASCVGKREVRPVVAVGMIVATLVPGEPATKPQIRAGAHWLQVSQIERAQPCDRYSPGWVSAPPVGGRHGLPEAPRYSVLAPDSLQIVPGLHLT